MGIAATITLLVVLYYFYEFHFAELCLFGVISLTTAALIFWWVKRGNIPDRPFERD